MEDLKMNIGIAFANTHQQHLEQHLFAVGYVARELISAIVDDEKLANAVYVAGCLHDIGKLDPQFQNWLKRNSTKNSRPIHDQPDDGMHIDKGSFNFENHPRHNETSLLLYYLLDNTQSKIINRENKKLIKHLLYWHHAKPIRKEEFSHLGFIYKRLKKSLGHIEITDFFNMAKVLLQSVDQIADNYDSHSHSHSQRIESLLDRIDNDMLIDLEDQKVPDYKKYNTSSENIEEYLRDVRTNAKASLARAALISADRRVSKLSAEQLIENIENRVLNELVEEIVASESDLQKHIQSCLDRFEHKFEGSERNIAQTAAALQLAEKHSIAVLNGPAGCGKTKIALEWAKNTRATKILWVCPRVQVCQGLFLDLTQADYLPDLKIELLTGEYKYIHQSGTKVETPENAIFSGDIVLTTIDQIINSVITHTNVTSLIDFLCHHAVFDEYHEYVHMPAFNMLFAELIQCKTLKKDPANTLLVSATPHYYFLDHVLDISKADIIGIKSFNNNKYQILYHEFDETQPDDSNPLFSPQPKDTIVISNTASTAQQSFIKNQTNENAILLHSRFKKSDKESIFKKVFEAFKKNGTKEYELLRSGPIVQASLNITCFNMVTEFTHAENTLQRLGRLDRFAENNLINKYTIAIPCSIAEGKNTGKCARFLNQLTSFLSARAWHEYLKENLPQGQVTTINELYRLYDAFYDTLKAQTAIEKDVLASFRKSVKTLSAKIHDPICWPKKKTSKKIRLKTSSLRGDNRYVQMAVCEIGSNTTFTFSSEYACDEIDSEDVFTLSIDEIEGYDPGGDRNLLNFMYQKHHKILSARSKKRQTQAFKSVLLKNQATEPNNPIYVSYTVQDLDLCNESPHPNAIYYVVGQKQAIGAMALNKFNNER